MQRKTTVTKPKLPKTTSKRTVALQAESPEVTAAEPAKPVIATAKAAAAPAPKAMPTQEEIARRAYEIYLARGQSQGNDVDDWVQAERELMAACHRNN